MSGYDVWKKKLERELEGGDSGRLIYTTPEGIRLRHLYRAEDLNSLHGTEADPREAFPGVYPFQRGPYASMFANRPWTLRQYAGFSTAEKSNDFFRRNLSEGQTGLSVAFDLPTHRGYDSDHPRARADVGLAGVAVDSIEDMKILFQGIELDRISVSLTMNGAVLPVLAAFIVAAEEQGVDRGKLRGTVQNDILKEYLVRNTYIHPPESSLHIVTDVIEFCSREMPLFNPLSVSGYHLQEAGATLELELACTLANALEYVRRALKRGLDIDQFAPRITFFFGVGMNFYMEIAKLRAARMLWAGTMKAFRPQDENSLILRTHCQTSGVSLTEQDPYNNVVRATLESLAAIFGGTQSLHTTALDEAYALPGEFSARLARNTQLIIRDESGIPRVVDPWGGSYFMESLTAELAGCVRQLMDEIERGGGMVEEILSGRMRGRIEERAIRRQALIDSGEEIVIGMNRFQTSGEERPELLQVDNREVLAHQRERLEKLRRERKEGEIQDILNRITEQAAARRENLLELSVEAIRRRATVGEITTALEKVYGRYSASVHTVSGIYGTILEHNDEWRAIRERVAAFIARIGRRPRILIAKMGQDGHDRGAHLIASAYSDLGFDVDVGPLFLTAAETARQAIENDVHVIGISSHTAAHRTLLPELLRILKDEDAAEIVVVCGGVVPPEDHALLYSAGVSAVFGPGTSISQSAARILDLLERGNISR